MVGKEIIVRTESYKNYNGLNGVVTRQLPDSDSYDYEVMFANGTYDYFKSNELVTI